VRARARNSMHVQNCNFDVRHMSVCACVIVIYFSIESALHKINWKSVGAQAYAIIQVRLDRRGEISLNHRNCNEVFVKSLVNIVESSYEIQSKTRGKPRLMQLSDGYP
jgi:hypothetical protein